MKTLKQLNSAARKAENNFRKTKDKKLYINELKSLLKIAVQEKKKAKNKDRKIDLYGFIVGTGYDLLNLGVSAYRIEGFMCK